MVSQVTTLSEKRVKEHMGTIIRSFIPMGNPIQLPRTFRQTSKQERHNFLGWLIKQQYQGCIAVKNQVPNWEPTNIMCFHTKFCHLCRLAPKICAPLSMNLLRKCDRDRIPNPARYHTLDIQYVRACMKLWMCVQKRLNAVMHVSQHQPLWKGWHKLQAFFITSLQYKMVINYLYIFKNVFSHGK
jgi:hypothetical protein